MPDLSQYGTVSGGAPDLSKYGAVSPTPGAAPVQHPGFWEAMLDTIKNAPAGIWHALTSSEYTDFRDSLNTITPEEWAQAKQHAQARAAGIQTKGPGIPDAEWKNAFPTLPEAAGRMTGQAIVDGALVAVPAGLGELADTELGQAVRTAAKTAAPDVVTGSAKIGLGAAAAKLPVDPIVREVLGVPSVYSGARQIARGLKAGAKAYADARAPEAEVPAAVPVGAAPVVPETPSAASTILQPEGSFVSRSDAIPSEHGVLPPLERSQFFRPIAENGAVDLSGYGSIAPARELPVAAPAPEPSPVPATPEAPAPAVDPARAAQQRIEDAADEQAARMRAHAEDIEWANRAHRADRFAAYMLRNGVEPTPVNLAAAARDMGEKGGPPSDETVPMIWDRMNYHPEAAEDATRSRLAETLTPPAGPENSRIAGETSQAQQVYDKLSGMSGPVSDAIAAGARELASGAGANEVKARTYAAVRKAISDTLPRTQEGISGGHAPGDSGGVSQASGAPSRARTPKVTSKRIKKIGDLGALGGQ